MASNGSKDVSSTAAPSETPGLAVADTQSGVGPPQDGSADAAGKSRKRDFFRFGKKTEEEKKQKAKSPTELKSSIGPVPKLGGLRPVSPLTSPEPSRSTISPAHNHPYGLPASPGRLRSASPRTHSPASSLIFERNVQEDVPAQASPQIPSHIITENHIPPAPESTSEAITDAKLDPDAVEIVTHATHQPAGVAIGAVTEPSILSSTHEDMPPPSIVSRQDTDNASNYGSLDVGDVRRLSFISFADVVHGEQEQNDQRRDSNMQSLSAQPTLNAPRSPSPIRSPVSSQALGTSPPSSVSPSVKGPETSPSRAIRAAGSPLPGTSSPVHASDINIETMRQALRKTGSGDLSAFRAHSIPVSPVSPPGEASPPLK